jgi:formate dehydrogenase maturation protein FdhE
MSDLRRQKRKAVRESKKNLTSTKIEDNLAIALDAYLKDEIYFKKQIELCDELELEYPKNAKTGYELPLFNKNPITNEIEIHVKSAELFTAYQVSESLINSMLGMDDKSDEYNFLIIFLKAMDKDPAFAKYLHDLAKIGEEKQKEFIQMLVDNIEEIKEKINKIFAE